MADGSGQRGKTREGGVPAGDDRQRAVEEAIARVFYGSVRTLAAAAIAAIDAWDGVPSDGERSCRRHMTPPARAEEVASHE